MPDDAVDASPTQHYTVEEAENIITALIDRVDCQLVMALACFLGLRPGEIAASEWDDFDEENVHIRRSVVRGIVGTPKTKESIASLPLIDRVRIPLELWRQKSPDTSGWVFPSVNNTPMTCTTCRARHPAGARRQGAGLEGYVCRAAWRGDGHHCLTNGNAAMGQALLRHKNMSTTLTF